MTVGAILSPCGAPTLVSDLLVTTRGPALVTPSNFRPEEVNLLHEGLRAARLTRKHFVTNNGKGFCFAGNNGEKILELAQNIQLRLRFLQPDQVAADMVEQLWRDAHPDDTSPDDLVHFLALEAHKGSGLNSIHYGAGDIVDFKSEYFGECSAIGSGKHDFKRLVEMMDASLKSKNAPKDIPELIEYPMLLIAELSAYANMIKLFWEPLSETRNSWGGALEFVCFRKDRVIASSPNTQFFAFDVELEPTPKLLGFYGKTAGFMPRSVTPRMVIKLYSPVEQLGHASWPIEDPFDPDGSRFTGGRTEETGMRVCSFRIMRAGSVVDLKLVNIPKAYQARIEAAEKEDDGLEANLDVFQELCDIAVASM